MAETFTGFGIGETIENQQRAFNTGDFEFLLKRLPQDLLKQLSELAEFGVFGEGGVDELMRSISKQGSLERNRLSKGLRRGKLGKRLGARSGAIDNLIANRVFAPSFAGTEGARRNLLIKNQESKLGGLGGIQDLLRFFQDQVGLQEELDQSRSGPGVLDFVGPAVDIASVAAAPFTGGASLAIPAARRAGGNAASGGFNAPLFERR